MAALLAALAGCSKAPVEAVADAASKAVNKEVTVPAGTRLKVRTLRTMSTNSANPGAPFEATLAEPLAIDGKTIAERGTTVRGVVADSSRGGRIRGVAHIGVRLTELEVGTGTEVHTNVVTYYARRTRKRDATIIGIGSGVGAAIGAIASGGVGAAIGAGAGGGAGTAGVLMTHGKPAVIPAESLLTFVLREPVRAEM
jgi:hypothetical protein